MSFLQALAWYGLMSLAAVVLWTGIIVWVKWPRRCPVCQKLAVHAKTIRCPAKGEAVDRCFAGRVVIIKRRVLFCHHCGRLRDLPGLAYEVLVESGPWSVWRWRPRQGYSQWGDEFPSWEAALLGAADCHRHLDTIAEANEHPGQVWVAGPQGINFFSP